MKGNHVNDKVMKDMNDRIMKDLNRGMKSMVKEMLPFWIIGMVITIGVCGGAIWFIFWCIRYFWPV
jgi:hypothetical protein